MDEMRHTEQLVDRIVYFDAHPEPEQDRAGEGGQDRARAVRARARISRPAQVERINGAIDICNDADDDGTRLVLEPMVTAGEGSIDWLETQLAALEALGDSHLPRPAARLDPPHRREAAQKPGNRCGRA